MIVKVNLLNAPYEIKIENGIIMRAGSELNLNRKVLIVTDSGVPSEYAKTVKDQCKEGYIETVEQGEDSKSLSTFERLQMALLSHNFSRKDCVVAVGGGVVGDLSGFVASTYMRGIDFYNIPTTVLSSVDSSVGGKTAVNLGQVKNIVGTFYQPKKVLIDPDCLNSLSDRLISNGLAEAVKMAAAFDEELFESFEKGFSKEKLPEIIAKSVDLKRKVVEEDEKESGLRKVLNFGHTLGHGYELTSNGELLHGESVALGMLMMCSDEVKERLLKVYKNLKLPSFYDIDIDKAIEAVSHDKKSNGSKITCVVVEKIGSFEFKDMTTDELKEKMIKFAEEH